MPFRLARKASIAKQYGTGSEQIRQKEKKKRKIADDAVDMPFCGEGVWVS